MDHGFRARSKAFVIVVLASATLMIGLVRNSSGVIPPCPVATDTTVAQMAQQWAASFKDPYCVYLQERSNILLKRKIAKGVFRQASELSDILRTSDEVAVSDVLRKIEKAAGRINLKNSGVRELAGAKMRVMKTGTALMTYAAGKKAFSRASRVDKTLGNFAPTAFDFSSRCQAQKDAAKLARIRGLIQAQELRLLSLLKMMDALEGDR
ncbi:MAG: hypothetical protein KA801_09625 [Syntrophorhabdaceae bacterium]|nr:hypothetical protein [Syntrophorhabdaceae bacterium]